MQRTNQLPLNAIIEEVENESRYSEGHQSVDEEEKEEEKNIVLDFEKFSVGEMKSNQEIERRLSIGKRTRSVSDIPKVFVKKDNHDSQYKMGLTPTNIPQKSETYRSSQ